MDSAMYKGFQAFAKKHGLPEALYPVWREAWFQSRKGVARVLVKEGFISNDMKQSVTTALRKKYENDTKEISLHG